MKKNTLLMIFFSVLLYSSTSFAGPWAWIKDQGSWVKDKVSSAWIATKRWRIPRPDLLVQDIAITDGKKCELFMYDLAKDSDAMKNLRKKLHVSGLYVHASAVYPGGNSDVDPCKKFTQSRMPEQYFENGFDPELNNSVSWCMFRLLGSVAERSRVTMSPSQEVAFMRLIWEVENCLPDQFDEDERLCIAFVRDMLTQAIVRSQKEEKSSSSQQIVSQPQQATQKKVTSGKKTPQKRTPAVVKQQTAQRTQERGTPFLFKQQNGQDDQARDFMTIFARSMFEDVLNTAPVSVPGQKIEQYLLLWRQYSLRFRSNLRKSIIALRRAYGVE